MQRKFLRLIIFIPILFVLVFTNIYQDPANLYHNESREIAEAILHGHFAYSATGNGIEREVRRNLIMNMEDNIDCVAMGSSVIMCVGKELVGTDSFLNLGVSGADYDDITAQLGIMDSYGKKPKRVILSLDAPFFNEELYGIDNDNFLPYALYMQNLIHGKRTKLGAYSTEKPLRTRVQQAFSISYFQASLAQIQRNQRFSMSAQRWGIVEEPNSEDRAFFGPDGSWHYAKIIRESDITFIEKDIAEYDINRLFCYDKHLTDEEKLKLKTLIQYLIEHNIEVELYLCPVSPGLWDRMELESNHFFYLKEIERYARDIAKEYGLKLTGSFNAYNLGITKEEFYDARHVRREVLGKYFDFQGKDA